MIRLPFRRRNAGPQGTFRHATPGRTSIEPRMRQGRPARDRTAMLLGLIGLAAVPAAAMAQAADASLSETPVALQKMETLFTGLVDWMAGWLFFDLGMGIPFIVLWLIAGAIFFTLRMGFINIRAFRHAMHVVRGDYDDPREHGELTHFQALTSALSATVGLGNIAGVTIAVTAGGAGAVFWMLAAGIFGMSSKFVECTLAQMYRKVHPDGRVSGGPMQYLSQGLAELRMPRVGKMLGGLFAVLCVGGCLGGGNMFQVNQSFELFASTVQRATGTDISGQGWLFGLAMMALVGVVIVGGIKRIGQATSRLVPTMCGLYVLASLFVIGTHVTEVPALLAQIFRDAWSGHAMGGGFLGVLVVGVQRAVFSNEAGIGSAAIAHAAAKTREPVREGIVALLGPFVDTVVICLMTALVILITGVSTRSDLQGVTGAALTSEAFASVIGWFPYVLTLAVMLFAYSTMISWSYYGERCWEFLFGRRWTFVFKGLFLGCILLGAVADLGSILSFSDIMILCMALPNIAGAMLLSGKVRSALHDYWGRYRAGGMPRRTNWSLGDRAVFEPSAIQQS